MKYICDNRTLMRYIPNIITSVEGEDDLFTKLTPVLIRTEHWLEYAICKPTSSFYADQLIPPADIYSDSGSGSGSGSCSGAGYIVPEYSVDEFACQAIAAEAFRMAVPSLDIVLTNNGFGIVSNNTIAPASRDRVNALIEGLIEIRDAALESMAIELNGCGHILGGRVFAGFDLQRAEGQSKHLLERFMSDRSREMEVERYIAEYALSFGMLHRLQSVAYDNLDERSPLGELRERVRSAIVARMTDKWNADILPDLVEFIRRNKESFPDWESSEAAKHWTDHRFKNDKSSGAFWL